MSYKIEMLCSSNGRVEGIELAATGSYFERAKVMTFGLSFLYSTGRTIVVTVKISIPHIFMSG